MAFQVKLNRLLKGIENNLSNPTVSQTTIKKSYDEISLHLKITKSFLIDNSNFFKINIFTLFFNLCFYL